MNGGSNVVSKTLSRLPRGSTNLKGLCSTPVHVVVMRPALSPRGRQSEGGNGLKSGLRSYIPHEEGKPRDRLSFGLMLLKSV